MLGTSLAVIALVGIALVTTLSVPAQAENASIPSWIKQVATLWGSGQISDAEFIAALQYLVQVGILVYQQTKFQGIVKYFFHVQGYAHSKWYNQ